MCISLREDTGMLTCLFEIRFWIEVEEGIREINGNKKYNEICFKMAINSYISHIHAWS